MIGCKYLPLTLSAACWVFWRAVMIGPFLWVLHNLSNSVRHWGLPLSWIPLCACHWTFSSSGSSPFPSLQFFQIGIIMCQSFDCGMANPSLTWCPVFLLEVGYIKSLSLLSVISSKVPPFEFWESLISQVSGAFWRAPLTSYLLRLTVSILSVGPQGFSPIPSLATASTYPPSHLPPPRDSFLFPPKWCWGIITWSLQLLIFLWHEGCNLNIQYYLNNIHLLVNTHHACTFGSGLPLSGWYFLNSLICQKNSWCFIFTSGLEVHWVNEPHFLYISLIG